MSESRGRGKGRGVKGFEQSPRDLASLALKALARYEADGMVKAGEHAHEALAARLSAVIASGKWA